MPINIGIYVVSRLGFRLFLSTMSNTDQQTRRFPLGVAVSLKGAPRQDSLRNANKICCRILLNPDLGTKKIPDKKKSCLVFLVPLTLCNLNQKIMVNDNNVIFTQTLL